MINFNAKTSEELEIEMEERSEEICVSICQSVCDALDINADKVIIGFITNFGTELVANSEGFLFCLEENLTRLENAEAYELCDRVKKWIEKLKTK
tara:strand:+ start:1094 stop:1378 length:285 start_codon:yes stop_codon:yes gene_type:complete